MATTREKIDSRGRNLLQLLEETESQMANLMNPAARNQGTYDGPNPDKPVDILYPKHASQIGAELGSYSGYFLREFNLDGKIMSDFGSGGGILTQAEHDRAGAENSALQGTVVDKWEGKQYANKLNHPSLSEDRSNFMKLKGRKSLLTLYWEMRGAFVNNNNKEFHWGSGQDGQDKTYTNRYTGEGVQSYNDSFNRHTLDFYYPPSGATDLAMSAANGFNLGQVLGPDITVVDSLLQKGKELSRDFIDRMVSEALESNDTGTAIYYSNLKNVLFPTINPDRVSQLFRPGFSRVQIPTNEVTPLKELLQQNLLLPPDGGISSLDTGSVNGVSPNMEDTYAALYKDNRVRDPGYPRFDEGSIAGTAINDLQEPLTDTAGLVDAKNGLVEVPFKFEDDHDGYLNYSQRRSGFINNGTNTVSNPNAMESAVTDTARSAASDLGSAYRINALDTIGQTEGQYFPFAFSTVNKKDSRVQVCALQATIQSLSESYTPTWQSKHFFGRSEQVHTYTFTDRLIDLQFIIFADSMRQLQNVYERVLWLSQQCYPDYYGEGDEYSSRMAGGPIIAMRVGDLLQHKAGFIRSLSYDWNFLGPGGKWELTRGMRMPQACNVSMSYQVIHEKVPSRNYNFYGGPDGGLSTGVSNLKVAEYGQSGVFDTSQAFDTVSGRGRYIPAGHIAAGYDDQPYLETVDNDPINSGIYNVNITADARDSYTGDASAVDED